MDGITGERKAVDLEVEGAKDALFQVTLHHSASAQRVCYEIR